MRPRVRVFAGSGNLIADRTARSRGRNLYFQVPVDGQTGSVVVSVEDHLGRYPSMFPYVIKVLADRAANEDEPS